MDGSENLFFSGDLLSSLRITTSLTKSLIEVGSEEGNGRANNPEGRGTRGGGGTSGHKQGIRTPLAVAWMGLGLLRCCHSFVDGDV